jgi:beta-glucosidase
MPTFPESFLWGAATSAYQIEGSPLADGAGPSNWHRFCHTPGWVANGDTGDVACDHYRRFREDVALMRDLGLTAYRFSISWSRVLPAGTGQVNQAGLDFYRRLLDALAEAGIAAVPTLYHWDLPAALDDRGGWLNRDSAGWFADYAAVCFHALDDRVAGDRVAGDRVAMWATLNEPWVVADGGHLFGTLAPGHRNVFEAPRVAHHLLLAHAAGVQAYRALGRGRIGVVVNLEPKHPATASPADRAAAVRADAYMNRHYVEPLLLGRYPAELAAIYGPGWIGDDATLADDLAAIATPIDWLGVNYYSRNVVRDAPESWPTGAARVRQVRGTHTQTDWEVYPDGLTETLRWVSGLRPELPLYVTENGAAFYDPPTATDGRVDDPLRVAYLRSHLRAVAAALAAGVDVRGYFAWSLLDNLEWSHGFSKRFGLVHVDFATLSRTPKASAHFYRDVARSRGASLV